ncbi:3'-5' exonuclease [Psychromicrobium xiongbiense]|uniref:3'-5' exonuclease n=1 Tax=Psychromicrobium xiongbiense TaxID=3051184 RepID=UPI002554F403|nr:3'-5' exonuclease [Psychromicrobium sp. YIM S02556]
MTNLTDRPDQAHQTGQDLAGYAWTALPRAAFDLETTGPDPQSARILSASVVMVDAAGGISEQWDWLADPGVPIPEASTAIHGITTERVRKEGRPLREVASELAAVLRGCALQGTPVVAFNASYDFTVLDRECHRLGLNPPPTGPVIDPYILDKQVDRFRKGKRTLVALCEQYGIDLEQAHTASADALAALRLAEAQAATFAELRIPATGLHQLQKIWAREQAASFQSYLHRQGRLDAVIDGTWPVLL